MKPLSKTYKELGIAFGFPIEIKNALGDHTYYENSRGYWCKWEYDANGKLTYSEDSDGFRCKRKHDSKGNQTYFEDSDGCERGTTAQ